MPNLRLSCRKNLGLASPDLDSFLSLGNTGATLYAAAAARSHIAEAPAMKLQPQLPREPHSSKRVYSCKKRTDCVHLSSISSPRITHAIHPNIHELVPKHVLDS